MDSCAPRIVVAGGADECAEEQRLRGDAAGPRGHAPHRAEEEQSHDRWAHDTASGLRDQPAREKTLEEVVGWMKTVGGLRKLRHRGGGRVNWQFLFAAAAYNMVRMRTLEATA